MNVSGVGGAASLPMILPSSTVPPATGTTAAATGTVPRTTTGTAAGTATATSAGTTGAAGTAGTSYPPADGPGELRLPGQPARPAESASRTEKKEAPKPEPLPPLKGLTVAEIRAMLGVAPMPGQTDAASLTAGMTTAMTSAALATSTVSAAFLRRYT